MAMAPEVQIIIKAPNQNVNDYVVHCNLDWTVQRLKNHLAKEYPNKPVIQDQKLIYSGRLLNDELHLKDFLRIEEGQPNVHILHLVCGSKNSNIPQEQVPGPSHSWPSNSLQRQSNIIYNNLPGSYPESVLRNRNNIQVPSLSAMFPQFSAGGNQNVPNLPNVPMDPQFINQMAAMQQMYNYYFTQYIQSLNTTASTPLPPNISANFQQLQNPNVPNENAVQRPANGNIRLNAQGRPIDDDEFGNRDWLDNFFLCCRFFILFLIIYFYSSPERLIIVMILALFVFLYHEGWFARRRNLNPLHVQSQRPNRNTVDENLNQENNRDHSSQQNQNSNTETEMQDGHEIEAAMDGDDPPHVQNPDAANNNSIFSPLTLLSAFFSSLIPEPPPPVNIN